MVAETAASGQLVADRYRLHKEVGRGGMAVVYCAHDEQLDRDVALKLVDAALASDQDFSTEFINEARAAARLHHPNVVTVFDVGEHGGRPFIVMELVEGGDLRSLLSSRGRLDSTEAARIAHGVARGLAALHARDLVHCDVKPHNILLTRDGEPKLVDFGIARLAAATGALDTSEVKGSIPYLSPEQVRGERIDPRTDVYALGILIYELLAGSPPFTGSSLAEVAAQRLHMAPRPVREVAPETPPALAAMIERALALEPAQRFADAGAMAEALAGLAEPEADLYAAATRVISPTQEGRRPGWRQALSRGRWSAGVLSGRPLWLIASLSALALLSLGAVAMVAWARPSGDFGRISSASLPGAASVSVPALAGLRLEEAAPRLQDAGLELDKAEEKITWDTPRGVIVTQDPAAGQKVKRGERVRLVVSQGVEVPNLVGQHWDDVKPWIDQNGWTLGGVRFIFASQPDFGKVVAQDPSPGSGPVADKQSTPISLSIAGPPEATRTGFPRSTGPVRPQQSKPATGAQRDRDDDD